MLNIKNLLIGYQKALHPTSFSSKFDSGQLIALLGRNGCGKTTFLQTLNRSISPISGEIQLLDIDISTYLPVDFAKSLSIVTTQKINTPFLKVYDLIAMGRHPYLGFLGKLQPKDIRFIDEIIEELQIAHLKEKYLADCSDGEQQLCLLARALAQDTPIILLDEATAHLDFVNRVLIFNALKTLVKKRKKLVFLATHELEMSLHFSDKVMLFTSNSIEIGIPSDLVASKKIHQVFELNGIEYPLNI